MSDPLDGRASTATAYLTVIQRHIQRAQSELEPGERLRVVVRTPEGLLTAVDLECLDPNVLVVRGVRGDRGTTLITPVELAQILIEVLPPPSKERPRPIGFRLHVD